MSALVGQRIARLLIQAEQQRRLVYTTDTADESALRKRVKTGKLVIPYPGMFAREASWKQLSPGERSLRIVRTLACKHPSWVFCSYSAALVLGLSVSYQLLERIHVVAPARSNTRSTARIRRHRLSLDSVEVVSGVPVTNPAQTVLSCLLEAPFPDGLAIADSAARLYQLEEAPLIEYVETAGRGRHGIGQARQTIKYVDARAESGGESIARAVMIEEGFQIPELQVAVPDPCNPCHLYRGDFLWHLDSQESRAARGLPYAENIIGEMDGFQKYTDSDMLGGATLSQALARERQRESRLTAYGIPIVRFTYADVRTPGRLAKILDSFGVPRAR